MALDPREFIRLHAGMPEHPKVDPLSDAAFRCLIEAWCLCRRSRNDGRLPIATWNKKWKLRARKELIDAGLVVMESDTAVMRDWLEHQPSVAELDSKRSAKAEAGRKGGVKSGQTRRGRSEGEANHEAGASPESDHESVTSIENYAESEPWSDVAYASENRTSSDDVRTSLPAETDQNREASASDLLEQTLKQNPNQIEPELEIEIESSYVGGFSYVSNARENEPRPPKHHREHPTAWVEDCAECTALVDGQIAWFVTAVPPAPYCETHPGGTPASCHACGEARRLRQDFDAAQKRAKAAHHSAEAHRTADARAQAISACGLCDEQGYRGTTVCDHDPGTVGRAVRGSAIVQAELDKLRAKRNPAPSPEELAKIRAALAEPDSTPTEPDQPTAQERAHA